MTEAALSRPTSKAGRIQRAALEALRRHEVAGEIPTSVRFLFYELGQAGHVSKVRTGARRADQDLNDATLRLREVGLVPWSWIVDETRSIEETGHLAPTAAGWLREMAEGAQMIDPWADTLRPLVITESRTTKGVFARGVCGEYRVAVTSTNGQARGFLINVVAPLLRDGEYRVLYVGDHDLAGNDIEANTRRVLEHDGGVSVPWERVALTDAQVEALRARGVEPIRKRDRRYRDGRPHEAFECEALGQGVLTSILRARLDELLPEPLEDVQERERTERATTLRLLGV